MRSKQYIDIDNTYIEADGIKGIVTDALPRYYSNEGDLHISNGWIRLLKIRAFTNYHCTICIGHWWNVGIPQPIYLFISGNKNNEPSYLSVVNISNYYIPKNSLSFDKLRIVKINEEYWIEINLCLNKNVNKICYFNHNIFNLEPIRPMISDFEGEPLCETNIIYSNE